MKVVFLLLALSFTSSQQIFAVNDPNWYFSDYNWAFNSTLSVRTANPGAYFKVGFTGTSLGLVLDETNSPSGAFMNLEFSVDDGQYKEISVPSGKVQDITLVQGLPITSNHSIEVYVYNSLQSADRWNVPQCALKITGLILDSGARTLPPGLAPTRLLVYGDSITEGVEANCVSGGDLYSNGATETHAFSLAAALNAEVSVVGFGRLGYTISGNGNVPPVYTPGDDTQSSWNKQDALSPRSFKRNPDWIVSYHGTNDGLNNMPDDAVTASVQGWLQALRAASPASSVIISIPFGGFKRTAISQGYKNYLASFPTDSKTFLMDLGTPAQQGLTAFVTGGTKESCDGIHPLVVRDGQLGAMAAVGIKSF